MYVIPSALCLPLLTIPFRHAFPSSPVVTYSQGTREVAVICESLSTGTDEQTYTFSQSQSEQVASQVVSSLRRVESEMRLEATLHKVYFTRKRVHFHK